MTGSNNTFREVVTNLTASSQYKIQAVNRDFIIQNDGKPCNFLFVKNNGDNEVQVQLNDSDTEIYPVDANGGTLVFSIEDGIEYTSLNLQEEDGNTVTGKVKVAGGVF